MTGFPSEGRRSWFSAAGRWMFCGFRSKATAALVVIKLSATCAEATFLSRTPWLRASPFSSVLFFSCCPGGLWKTPCLMFALPLLPHCVSWTFGSFSYIFDTQLLLRICQHPKQQQLWKANGPFGGIKKGTFGCCCCTAVMHECARSPLGGTLTSSISALKELLSQKVSPY